MKTKVLFIFLVSLTQISRAQNLFPGAQDAPIIKLQSSAEGTPSYGYLEFHDSNSRLGFLGFGSSLDNNMHFKNYEGRFQFLSDQPVLSLHHPLDGSASYGYIEFHDSNSRLGFMGFGSSLDNNMYFRNYEGTFNFLSDQPILSLHHPSNGTESYGYIEFHDADSRLGFMGFGSSLDNNMYFRNYEGTFNFLSDQPILSLHHPSNGIESYGYIEFHDADSRLGFMGFGSSLDNNMHFKNSAGGSFVFLEGGVRIGEGDLCSDCKLDVDGKIRSEEVVVEVVNGPDYVFEDDYYLRTLRETEDYIKQNKHLPEIPSAREMEANGVELGEMNMNLLKKIEELTLYLIDQNNEISAMKQVINKQQKLIEELNTKVNSN